MGLHAGKIYNGEPNPCKMTVWSVEPKGKSVVVKLTSSKKSANGWETDFSMNCCFVKEAAKHAINLKEKDKIIVKSFEVLCKWDKANNRNNISIFVYDFTMADGSMPVATSSEPQNWLDVPDGYDDDLPFN